MMSLTFGLFTQVSGSGPLGPLVILLSIKISSVEHEKSFITSGPVCSQPTLSLGSSYTKLFGFRGSFQAHKCVSKTEKSKLKTTKIKHTRGFIEKAQKATLDSLSIHLNP